MKCCSWTYKSWNEKWNLSKLWKWEIDKDKFIEKMAECGFTSEKNKYGYHSFTNPSISINLSPEYSELTLSTIEATRVSNIKTRGALSCNGYVTFGSYIMDKLEKDFLGGYWNNLNNFTDYAAWEDFFFAELKSYVSEIKIKVDKQNKKKEIKDKIQAIESDIDYAILDYYEEHKDKGIELDKSTGNTQNVSVVYMFKKIVQGMGNVCGAIFTLRKTKNGTWEFYYKDNSWVSPSDTKIRCLKEGATPEDVKKLLDGYFSPWYEIPKDINPKWTFSLDNISEYKNGN